MKNYFKFLLIWTLVLNITYGMSIVDCRVVTKSRAVCNPYTSQLLYVKEINYNINKKKLIIQKNLPTPTESRLKVISVEDMMERYVDVEDSVRFEGTQEDISVEDIKDDNKTDIKKIKYGTYLIVSGDTLSKIASKFDITTSELKNLNKLNPNLPLRIDQAIKIPFPQDIVDGVMSGEYKVKNGDTLSSIANKFNLKTKKLIKYNNIKSNTIIRIGNIIKLPLPYILMVEDKKRELEAKREALIVKKREDEAKRRDKTKINMIGGIGKRSLRVTATAYSSHHNQTDGTPFLAAWNNRIRPGMKIIAVSRDMLTQYGLDNGTRVRIGGLPGYYTVRDKMNKRYRKRIDIYMGLNRNRALHWGRRSVVLYW